MKYRRNSDADIRALERAWETSRSPEDLERLNVAKTRAGQPIFYAHQLEFGYNPGLPPQAPAAWGARAILERGAGGGRQAGLLPDRQSMVGPEELRIQLRDALNGGALAAMQRQIARLYRKGEIRDSEAREVVLYDDPEIRIIGNTNASHGYIYLVAYIKPAGWTPPPAPTISCDACHEEFDLNSEELAPCTFCGKSLCENCRDICPHCSATMCAEPHIRCRSCEEPICTSDRCERQRPSKECTRCGELYCYNCRLEVKNCPCAEEVCDECGDEIETCDDCGSSFCSCQPCPCREEEEDEEEGEGQYRYNPEEDDEDFELGGWAVVHDSGDLIADGFETEASAQAWLKMAADEGQLDDELGSYHVTEVED